MYDCYITFRSITGSQMGSKLLERAGIYHQMLRSPKSISPQGCGYALRVHSTYLEVAMDVIRRGMAPYQHVYREYADGQWEEIGL